MHSRLGKMMITWSEEDKRTEAFPGIPYNLLFVVGPPLQHHLHPHLFMFEFSFCCWLRCFCCSFSPSHRLVSHPPPRVWDPWWNTWYSTKKKNEISFRSGAVRKREERDEKMILPGSHLLLQLLRVQPWSSSTSSNYHPPHHDGENEISSWITSPLLIILIWSSFMLLFFILLYHHLILHSLSLNFIVMIAKKTRSSSPAIVSSFQ